MRNKHVQRLTQLGMLAAISVALLYFIHFPIFSAAPYLKYDPGDVPLYLSALLFGPVTSVFLTAVVCAVQSTISVSGGIIGVSMHFASAAGYVLVAGFLKKKLRCSPTVAALVAMLAGIFVVCVTMTCWNLLVTPLYTGRSTAEIAKLILPVILPFNFIKAAANSLLTFLLYKTAVPYIKRYIQSETTL